MIKWVVWTLFFCAAGASSWAAAPPKEPVLLIETGMHTAMIKGVAADAAGRYLVTASDDKSARVWETATGRLLRIIRPPVGAGNEGKLFAVALSPDGSTIACGGWTGWDWDGAASVYLFDRASGRLIKRLDGFPDVIKVLVFSPDGRYLAAALGAGKGVYLLRTADWRLAAADREYQSDCYGADFDKTGRLVTTSWDGSVRLYGPDLRLVAKRRMPEGERPHGVSFSPDGARIAVGSVASARVAVLSGGDLSPLYQPDAGGMGDGALFNVAWSADGKSLLAAGSCRNERGATVRRWQDGGKGPFADLPLADGDLMQLLAMSDGRLAFAAAGPEIGILGANGEVLLRVGPAIADYRGEGEGLLLAPDGGAVSFSHDRTGQARAVFSIAERSLALTPAGLIPPLAPPVTAAEGLLVTEWRNGFAPRLNGKPLRLEKFETSRSLAIAPDRSGFLLGTDWHLRFFDRRGEERWRVPTAGIAWGVNIAGNGRVAVAAYSDGTIRWHRLTDGKELLAFFPHNDRKRWLLWTPAGYYDASAGAEELIGWQVNNGRERAADFFPVSRFRSQYYRPGVIAGMLATLDEARALRLADAAAGREKSAPPVAAMLPPVVEILSPADGSAAAGGELAVRFTVRAASGGPLAGIKVLVDGRPVPAPPAASVTADGKTPREISVPLPDHDCAVSVIAEDRNAVSEPATVTVLRQGGGKQEEFSFQPKLYILAVGVGAYPDKDLALEFAAKDARDFVAAMQVQKGGLYRDVTARLITDRAATRDAILEGLEWLQRETTSKDVALLFMSGHGVTDANGVYYYLPVNADADRLKSTGVVFSEIRNTLTALAGKTALFIDTCHSGSIMGKRRAVADINAVVNELTSAENGVVVFASSTGRQYSLEDASWGNGAFTKALLEGLGGKADYSGKGKITVNMLDLWLSERVKELTEGRQTPTTTKPQTIQDFPLAVRR